MILTQIDTFIAIVETGSLVKASRYLNVTQSTVTARLKALEDEIGQRLIHRQKSGVVLTASGLKFRRYAQSMRNMWRQALVETALPEGMESVCNLGCEADLWATAGRLMAKWIKQHYPTAALTIRQSSTDQLEQWLGIGLIDAAFSHRQSTVHSTTSIPLAVEVLALVSTNNNSPERGDPGYVYYEAGDDFASAHTVIYADAGVSKHSFDSAAWTLDYLLDCGGSAFLPKVLAAPYIKSGALFEVAGAPTFTRNVYLITNTTAQAGWPWFDELLEHIC